MFYTLCIVTLSLCLGSIDSFIYFLTKSRPAGKILASRNIWGHALKIVGVLYLALIPCLVGQCVGLAFLQPGGGWVAVNGVRDGEGKRVWRDRGNRWGNTKAEGKQEGTKCVRTSLVWGCLHTAFRHVSA